jgi:hypothetical protein
MKEKQKRAPSTACGVHKEKSGAVADSPDWAVLRPVNVIAPTRKRRAIAR